MQQKQLLEEVMKAIPPWQIPAGICGKSAREKCLECLFRVMSVFESWNSLLASCKSFRERESACHNHLERYTSAYPGHTGSLEAPQWTPFEAVYRMLQKLCQTECNKEQNATGSVLSATRLWSSSKTSRRARSSCPKKNHKTMSEEKRTARIACHCKWSWVLILQITVPASNQDLSNSLYARHHMKQSTTLYTPCQLQSSPRQLQVVATTGPEFDSLKTVCFL